MERIEIFSIHNNNIRRKQLRTFEKIFPFGLLVYWLVLFPYYLKQ